MSLIVRDRSGWVTRWNAGEFRPSDPSDHIRAALAEAAVNGGGQLVLWIEQANTLLDAAAKGAGLTQWRKLLQMRCALPSQPCSLHTRAFTKDDAAAFLLVNNRAFSWHPEQGGWTADNLVQHYDLPWFEADGFRIYEKDGKVRSHMWIPSFFANFAFVFKKLSAQVAAFCWTKIHQADASLGDPQLGEIYVIAVDPDFQGQGIGTQVVLAGLEWLGSRGVSTGMLYVEHDNVAALRIYERIGFRVHHSDHAYRIFV